MENTAALQDAEAILDRYSNMVLRTAAALVKNQHDAQDIAQDVFVSLIRAKPVFESEEHQKAWLLRVTINRCKSFLRSTWQRRTQGIEETMADTAVHFTPDESMVLEAVNALPLKYRQVIYLYYIEGYATGEIAALLKIPQNTVLSQMARARRLLKEKLKGEFDDV